MRPKQHATTGSGDLFRARLEQIINMKHELVQLAGKLDWDWLDGEIAPLYSDQGRPGFETRFVIGLLLLKHIYGLSDEGVCERWVHDPYFQFFTGEEFFQQLPARGSDLSHGASGWATDWSCCWPRVCGWRTQAAHCGRRIWRGSRSTPPCSPRPSPSRPTPSCCMRDQGPQPPGQEAWRAVTAVLSAHRQAGRHDGGALCPRQAVQPPSAAVTHPAHGSAASSATSTARSPTSRPCRRHSNGRSRVPARSVRSSNASAAGSCIPSMLPRSNVSARQGQRTRRVRRQGFDRHHQRPRPGRPVRAARQGATRQSV